MNVQDRFTGYDLSTGPLDGRVSHPYLGDEGG